MRKLRNLLTIILSALVFSTSAGFSFCQHACNEEITTMNCCQMEASCATCPSCSVQADIYLQFDYEVTPPATQFIEFGFSATLLPVSPLIPVTLAPLRSVTYALASPLLTHLSTPEFLQVFRN